MPPINKFFFLLSGLFFSLGCYSQTALEKLKQYHTTHEQEIVNDFISFLSIPNVATDTEHIRKNADFLFSYMNSKGLQQVQLLEGDGKNVPPVVYGELNVPGATRT
ncbi:MAG: hypothetical protein ACJ75B_05220, partial [Flavisolibacter sp.]